MEIYKSHIRLFCMWLVIITISFVISLMIVIPGIGLIAGGSRDHFIAGIMLIGLSAVFLLLGVIFLSILTCVFGSIIICCPKCLANPPIKTAHGGGAGGACGGGAGGGCGGGGSC